MFHQPNISVINQPNQRFAFGNLKARLALQIGAFKPLSLLLKASRFNTRDVSRH